MKIMQLIFVAFMACILAACGGTARHSTSNAGYANFGGSMYDGTVYGTSVGDPALGGGYVINNYGPVSELSRMVADTLGPNFGANCALRLPDYVTIGKPGTNNAIIVANTGSVLAGNISDIFVGHNSYGDLLIVTKVTGNGTGYVIGYNVIVSFCVDNKSFYAGSNVLSFIAPNGITLTVNANGAFGGATSSYTQTVTSTNPNVSIPNSFVSLLN